MISSPHQWGLVAYSCVPRMREVTPVAQRFKVIFSLIHNKFEVSFEIYETLSQKDRERPRRQLRQ